MRLDRSPDALPLAEKAYELAITKLDDSDVEYIIAHSRLAFYRMRSGQTRETQQLLRPMIQSAESVLGTHNSEFLALLNNLSLSYFNEGKFDEALPYMLRVVDLKREIYGHANWQNAGNLQDLIKILEELDRVGDTEPYVRELAEIIRKSVGETDSNYLLMLENLARACLHSGKESEGRELLGKLRAQGHVPFIDFSAKRPANEPSESTYVELAKQLYAKGDYDEARDVHRKILEVSPESNLLSQITLGMMGHMFDPLLSYCEEVEKQGIAAKEAGDFDKAAGFFRQRIEMIRVSFGEHHPYVALSLSNLGLVRQKQGDFEEAKNLFREAVNMLGDLEKLPPEYDISRNVAALYWDICEKFAPDPGGSFDEILDYLKNKPADYSRSLRIAFPTGDPDKNPIQTNAEVFIARTRLYESIGDHERARFLYETALEMMRMVWSDQPKRLLFPMQRLATHCIEHGHFNRADELLQEETQISAETFGENSLQFAESLRRRARLLSQLGNEGDAKDSLVRALEIFQEEFGDESVEALMIMDDLIVILMRMGRPNEAEPLMRQFLDGFDEGEAIKNKDYEGLQQAGTFWLQLKDFERAERFIREALRIQKERIGDWDPRYALTLSNLGNLLRLSGRFSEAATCFNEALEKRRLEFGPNHRSVAASEIRLAITLAAIGEEERALNAVKDVMRIDDLLIADVSSISSQSQILNLLGQQRFNLNIGLTLIYQSFRNQPQSVQDAYEIVLRRKGLSAEALASRRLPILSGRYPRLHDKLSELNDLTSQVTQARLGGISENDALIKSALERKSQLEAELSRAMPEMRLEHFPNRATVQQIVEALPPGSVLIEYVRIKPYNWNAVSSRGESDHGSPRYLAFLLRHGESDSLQMLDLGEADPIEENVETLVKDLLTKVGSGKRHLLPLTAAERRNSFLEAGLSLRNQIIDPILSLVDSTSKIFVVPDGDLFLLPFDVLPLDAQRYLIDEFDISFLGAGRDVLRFAKQADVKHTAPVVLGGADFNLHLPTPNEEGVDSDSTSSRAKTLQGTKLRFGELAGAEAEAAEVASLVKGAVLLSKDTATASVLRELKSPLLLHLATHGFFLPPATDDSNKFESPMISSGLALSGANTWLKGEGLADGLLVAEDVATLNLLETDLVVLSACESGLGGVVAGEGVFGLRRAFFAAGVRTIVMSLWQVPDQETKELMIHFYSALLEGVTKSEALRQAKLAIKRLHPHPFYWGSFICEGDWHEPHKDLF
ncbi:MAG TPA: CHAT domain-containing tetratricopeptide repeat protein [Pyrinomonadaceae bacterium]|nr:CHAT domain-containing tetratricopeptide repeat protein [Pyrinomonadaceae bacterium]